jgi:hypothetical protein
MDRVRCTPPHPSAPRACSPTLEPLPCYHCGVVDIPRISAGAGPHAFRANCAHCGTFLQWVSTRSTEERVHRREQFRKAAMGSKPPTAAQIAFLVALGDRQPAPTTMAEASARIDQLRKEASYDR